MMIVIIIFGLIIGSFLNVVIYRLYHGGSIMVSRSICPSCRRQLTASELVPVLSFIVLRGRCRTCRKKISWQYPVVELITALSFFLLAQNFQFPISNFQFWFQVVFASFLIVIGVFDLKHYLILDKVVWPATGLAIIANILFGNLLSGLLAGVGLAAFFLAQYLFSQGRWIGFGDVKLGFLLGNILGWPVILAGVAVAYLTGAAVGLALIAAGRKRLSSQLPFGTFLSFSAIIMLIWGAPIVSWYFKLIGL